MSIIPKLNSTLFLLSEQEADYLRFCFVGLITSQNLVEFHTANKTLNADVAGLNLCWVFFYIQTALSHTGIITSQPKPR